MPSQHTLGGAAASLIDSNIPYDIFIRNLKLLRAGRVIVDFEIILEKNRVIFYGPPNKNKSRTVRGKVRLEVAGRLNVKEIMITLAGEFHITNENSITSTSTSDDIPLQGTLFSTCILLENKRTLNPGVHDFFFDFCLPGDLPASMSSDLILCEYFLKAELTVRGPGEFSPQNKIVDVVDLYVQRAMLQIDPSIKPYLDSTRYTGSKDKILDFEFILPKMLRLNTDVLTLHARWDGLRVDNVKFWFVQTESFKDLESNEEVQDFPSNRKTKIISGPYCFEMPKKEPLKLQSRPMFFQLPITEPFVSDYDLYNVEITHQLIISIQMANKNKENIQLSIPIIIASVVENTDMVPPPCHISQSDQEASLQFANKTYYGKFLEDYNNQQRSSPTKRLTRAERKKEADDDLKKSTAESVQTNEQTTIRVPRRTTSHIIRRDRDSSINNNDVNVINFHNSIGTINESASEFSNENSNTIATTVTYTNNTDHERSAHGFSQKGTQKPTLVIAEKINNLLRNRSNRRSVSMNKKGTKRTGRASSSASAVKFAPPGLLEVFNRFPNANVNNGSLTT